MGVHRDVAQVLHASVEIRFDLLFAYYISNRLIKETSFFINNQNALTDCVEYKPLKLLSEQHRCQDDGRGRGGEAKMERVPTGDGRVDGRFDGNLLG